jgi:hypothetical protein
MAATWLASPLIALVRPAAAAVAGDLWRRWRIGRRFTNRNPSDISPVIDKAIADMQVLVGRNALLTESVANLLDELKRTGLLELIAKDAFYEINDDGVRVYFEVLFARHTPTFDMHERQNACHELYNTIKFILRESIRAQLHSDILFIFDSFVKHSRVDERVSTADKVKAVVAQVRPDIVRQLGLSGQTILTYTAGDSHTVSGLNQSQFPPWLHLAPEQLEQQVKIVSAALVRAYEFVRLDGPAQRSYDCEIDKLYVPARPTAADFSIQANALQERRETEAPYTELLPASSQCIILGDPGGGKSTLAQRVCLDALRMSATDGRFHSCY